MKKWECSTCHKKFNTKQGATSHIRDYHPKKKDEAIPAVYPRRESEESMADIFVNAYLNRAMGEKNEDWVEDMLS